MEYWVENILEIFLSIPHYSIIPTFQYPKGIIDDSYHFYCWKIG